MEAKEVQEDKKKATNRGGGVAGEIGRPAGRGKR